MRLLASVIAVFLLSSSLLDGVSAGTHALEPVLKKRHFARSPGNERSILLRRDASLVKRFDQARFSFYDAGLGACGKSNSASDFIVALNSEQFDAGSQCFKMITITYNGKTTQAQITDRCPGCPFGGLDFSRGLFDYFTSESAGIIYGSWVFGSGDPAPQPKTTTTTPPPPSTTWTPTTSSTPPPSSSASSSSVVLTSSSSQSTITSSSAASSTASSVASSISSAASAVTSSTGDSTPAGVLAQLNQIILDLGVIAVAAASVQN